MNSRLLLLWWLASGLLVLLLAAGFKMQVLDGRQYRQREQRLRSAIRVIPAPRGRILDAAGRLLAEDVVSYDLEVAPALLPLHEVVYSDVAYLLANGAADAEQQMRQYQVRLSGVPLVGSLAADLEAEPTTAAALLLDGMVRAARQGSGSVRVPLARDLPFAAWVRVKVKAEGGLEDYSGVFCVSGIKRRYPYGPAGCHVLGYTRPLEAPEAARLREDGALLADAGEDSRRLVGNFLNGLAAESNLKRRVCDVAGDLDSTSDFPEAVRRLVANRAELRSLAPPALRETLDEIVDAVLIRELAPAEQLILAERPYLPDDRIGAAGLEYRYNRLLTGTHGVSVVERAVQRDRQGAWLRYLVDEKAHAGGDLHTTLDIKLQQSLEAILAALEQPAAGVLMRVADGGIIAMASKPGFEPAKMRGADARQYLDAPQKPLLCRAYQEHYPPGSVFKVIDAVAALSRQVTAPASLHTCAGSMFHERHDYKCSEPHGQVDLTLALGRSCNVFFYRLALLAGKSPLLEAAQAFGLGRRTGVDLPFEASGVLPAGRLSERDLLFVAIGQGPVAATPLQMACVMAAIATRGRLPRPRLSAHRPAPFTVAGAGMSAGDWEALANGMVSTVHMPVGTAYSAFHTSYLAAEPAFCAEFPYILVAGKTGTAEHGVRQAAGWFERERPPPHSWFACFAPADAPEVALAIVIECGGRGGGAASRAAARMLSAYFRYTRRGASCP